MTSLLEGAKKLVTRGTDIGARIDGLDARGRRPRAVGSTTPLVDEAARGRRPRRRAGSRLSADHTVVAIAGATGSGKSSTFNALTGLELAAVGVRRPTTSWATACVWGSEGAEELLEWLGIPPRHQITRDSMLDSGRRGPAELDGVVLLDLPDHDSTEVVPPPRGRPAGRARRPAGLGARPAEVRRRRDPRPLPRAARPAHQDVMLVVLNHIDTVPEDRRAGDARRRPPAARRRRPRRRPGARRSAPATASGIAELRARDRQAGRREEGDPGAARRPTSRGRRRAARRGRPATARPATLAARSGSPRSTTRFADAAGVPTVVDAVERLDPAARRPGHRLAGRPPGSPGSGPTRSSGSHLDLGAAGKAAHRPRPAPRCPQATQVQRARVDTEVRALADDVSAGWRRPWVDAVRRASVSRLRRPRRPARPAPSPPPTSAPPGSRCGPGWCGCCSGC